jgi:hypothetical protein
MCWIVRAVRELGGSLQQDVWAETGGVVHKQDQYRIKLDTTPFPGITIGSRIFWISRKVLMFAPCMPSSMSVYVTNGSWLIWVIRWLRILSGKMTSRSVVEMWIVGPGCWPGMPLDTQGHTWRVESWWFDIWPAEAGELEPRWRQTR